MNSPIDHSSIDNDMFRPPVNRAMRVLDRSFFKKSVSVGAAKVQDRKKISRLRSELSKDMLKMERMQMIQNIPQSDGQISKAILLRPEIKYGDPSTWSATLSRLVEAGEIRMMPFDLDLDYDYWGYHDIMGSVMPEELKDEFPTGFSVVGHVVHLNLRVEQLPHKHLIASVLLDKIKNARTVINKIADVGSESVYRTFRYELLAGDADLNVEINEDGCTFRFDYSKVYWNSRLNTEHSRIVQSFKPGEAICDVMAGVGPFAVPAGKKRCWVMANDLNPEGFASLKDAVERNKVDRFVLPFNDDGRTFIKSAAEELLSQVVEVDVTPPSPRSSRHDPAVKSQERTVLQRPRVFAHYILNLPASALTFLPSFVGLYAGHEEYFEPYKNSKLPLIHVYCFNLKSYDNEEAEIGICEEISKQLDFTMSPGGMEPERKVSILDVRDVAPKKRMFCATFRLPAEVAFRMQ